VLTSKPGEQQSKVREASIQALEFFLLLCAEHGALSIVDNSQLIVKCLGGIMQQAVERIDRTRSIAGKMLANLSQSRRLSLDCLESSARLRAVLERKSAPGSTGIWRMSHFL